MSLTKKTTKKTILNPDGMESLRKQISKALQVPSGLIYENDAMWLRDKANSFIFISSKAPVSPLMINWLTESNNSYNAYIQKPNVFCPKGVNFPKRGRLGVFDKEEEVRNKISLRFQSYINNLGDREKRIRIAKSNSMDMKEYIEGYEFLKIYSTLEDYETIKRIMPEMHKWKFVDIFKDKFLFRDQLKHLHKKFKYELLEEPKEFKKEFFIKNPKVMKPTKGISSKGVKILNKDSIKDELFLIDASKENPILLEDYIEGDEFAVDGFFDSAAKPVIINIMKHEFFSNNDVSDYLYYTNYKILLEMHDKVYDHFEKISKIFGNKIYNFPFHYEFKIDKKTNKLIPIELNPLRFSGYGTCDLSYHAYGINPYSSFFENSTISVRSIEDLWNALKKDKNKNYAFITLENDDHAKINKEFLNVCNVVEYRMIEIENDPIKAIVFVEFEEENLQKIKDLILKINNIGQN